MVRRSKRTEQEVCGLFYKLQLMKEVATTKAFSARSLKLVENDEAGPLYVYIHMY